MPGVTIDQLVTVGVLDQYTKIMLEEIKNLRGLAARGADELLEVNEAADFVKYGRATIIRWIKEGKPGRHGTVVKLPAYEFSPGQYRISKNDLIAFGKVNLE